MGSYSHQAVYNTIGTTVTLFSQWLIMMLIPSINNFSEAGIFAISISVCSILNHVATFSLKEYQISDQNSKFSDSEYAYTRLITIAISFVGILPISILFGYDLEEVSAIIAYMIYRNLLHFAYVYSASLQVAGRLDYVGKCMTAEGIVSFITFIFTYVGTDNLVLSIFVMAVFGGGLFCLTQSLGYKNIVKKQIQITCIDKKKIKRLLKIGFPLFLAIISPTITTALPKLFLQAIENNEIAGIFSTLSTPTIIIPTLVISVFSPLIVYFSDMIKRGDVAKFKRKYLQINLAIILFGVLCVGLSILVQGWVFNLLYGDEISEYVNLFAILVLGITFYSVGTCGSVVLIIKNQGRISAIASLISLIVGLVLCIMLIPGGSIEGATCALVCAYATYGGLVAIFSYFYPIT